MAYAFANTFPSANGGYASYSIGTDYSRQQQYANAFGSNPCSPLTVRAIQEMYGVNVVQWTTSPNRNGYEFLFANGKRGFLPEGCTIDAMTFKTQRETKSFCASCGGRPHMSEYWENECDVTRLKFWAKARKLYWHRYQKVGRALLTA